MAKKMPDDTHRSFVERLLGMALREEVFITAVNAIVGWIVYNVFIDVYGFSWPHAVFFGLVGYVAQVVMFRSMLSFMRSVEDEAMIRFRRQTRLTEYLRETPPESKDTQENDSQAK